MQAQSIVERVTREVHEEEHAAGRIEPPNVRALNTLVLVDPTIAHIAIDARRRSLAANEFRGTHKFLTDFEGATLECTYVAKETGGRGDPVEHSVTIEEATLVSTCGKFRSKIDVGFLKYGEYEDEIASDLDSEVNHA